MEDSLLNLSNPKNGNKEIYVHTTLMESIESVFSTSFQDVGKFFRGNWNFFFEIKLIPFQQMPPRRARGGHALF